MTIPCFFLQEILPEILANMSDILRTAANDMNAKDERFISQGIYNLLYGTVELLMVSAEATVVTGDSGALSADQIKVGWRIQDCAWKVFKEVCNMVIMPMWCLI